MPRKTKKSHNDLRGTVCICCLVKLKTKWPKKVDDTLSSLIVSNVYPEFVRDKEFLPTSICAKCIDLVKSQSDILPLVKYVELVENVKKCQINDGENVTSICEVCRLGAVSSLNVKIETSEFLFEMRNTKKGRIPAAKQLKVTDLVPDNTKTKEEKLNYIAENSSPDSLQQLSAIVVRKQVKYHTEPLIIYFIISANKIWYNDYIQLIY